MGHPRVGRGQLKPVATGHSWGWLVGCGKQPRAGLVGGAHIAPATVCGMHPRIGLVGGAHIGPTAVCGGQPRVGHANVRGGHEMVRGHPIAVGAAP